MSPIDVDLAKRKPISTLTSEERMAIWESEHLNWSDPRVPANAATAARIRREVGPPAEPTIKFVCLADVEMRQVDWLWNNRIPRGLITVVEGIEGVGKSTLLCAIAAAVTRGVGLEDMTLKAPAVVLWLSAEDDLGMVLKPRLASVGADMNRVIACGDPFTFDDDGMKLLRDECEKHKPDLVIIDPLFAYTKGDPSRGPDARLTTNVLKKIAEEFGCALVLVRHVGKSKGLGDPRAAGLYSIEWRAAARSVLLVGCDPDTPDKRAITQTKNNLGPLADSIGYVIEPDSTSPSGARFTWTGISDLSAKRILEMMGNDEERAEKKDAEAFLREMLTDGEHLASDLMAEAKRCSISEKTLRRAKQSLKIVSRHEGFGKKVIWYWCLPETCLDGQPTQNGHLKVDISEQTTSEQKICLDGQLAIYVGEGSPHTLSNGHLSEKIPPNPNDDNYLPLDGQNSQLAIYADDYPAHWDDIEPED